MRGKHYMNSNMSLQQWAKVKIDGDKPSDRYHHATCCIAGPLTGQDHPLLMVVGGMNKGELGDVWLLDVDKGMWSEVSMNTVVSECVHCSL